ncbi:MAG: 4'-phosphopantetheinyl transferase superfamily protein [Clostridia bacterium]|nr:4'-phosphopantetheinyl transferase superfamily protein [Clostridia bacterium]MBO7690622.1 4'-phosphopantetheinyl transferase superfamily protein [Clostridia bacterium]MBP5272232.1 4'-phosphopantetheinyl transferase superfamily protein [Clostridia bacterium]MBP5459516.1 4'-phosphopantetheinyl transferase superfamily protein [Clostridia bacterium]
MTDKVQLYFWDAKTSEDYPPSAARLAVFPAQYAERYRNAKTEDVKMQAVGSATLLAMYGEELTDDRCHVNLSHSGSLTVLAVANGPVGVDIEHRREVSESIVDRFFPDSFKALVEAAPPEQKQDTALECWTKLEAGLKADGRGLTPPRSEFESILSRYDIETEWRDDLCLSVATEK